MTEQLAGLRVSAGVATITLDSPANRNALSAPLRAQLAQALRSVAGDPAVRVVLLTHTGTAFCSGMDLTETIDRGGPEVGLRELADILLLLARSPQPVLAQVSGAVRGGGLGLLAASDIVVASPAATFAFSEVRLGLTPAVISPPVLGRVPAVWARELMLTGAVFGAERAERIGLVNQVQPAATLDDAVRTIAGELKAGAPGAQARIRRLLADPTEDLEGRYTELVAESVRVFSGGEAVEGISARRERRAPAWSDGTAVGP